MRPGWSDKLVVPLVQGRSLDRSLPDGPRTTCHRRSSARHSLLATFHASRSRWSTRPTTPVLIGPFRESPAAADPDHGRSTNLVSMAIRFAGTRPARSTKRHSFPGTELEALVAIRLLDDDGRSRFLGEER